MEALHPFSSGEPMRDGHQLSWRGWIAMLLFMGATVFPAQALAGFAGFTFGLGWMGLIVLAIIAGAISGLIFDRGHPVARFLAGAIGGPCVTLAIFGWLNGRQEAWNFEVVLVGIVAMLPALGIGWVLTKLLGDGGPSYSPEQQGYPPYPYGANPYGQSPYGQNPYAQNPYGQVPPGQHYQGYPSAANPYPQNSPPQNQPTFTFGNYPQDPSAPRQP
jgi:hypothetical protein